MVSFNDDWWLSDLGSRNGILVNGIRLTNARRLRSGDEIRIANHRIVFYDTEQSDAQRSSIIGKTTQVALQANDGIVPAAATPELVVTTADGEIIEGEKAANWFFGKNLERAHGVKGVILPKVVRQWLKRLATSQGVVPPLDLQEDHHRVIVSFAHCKEERIFLLMREESSKLSFERLEGLGLTKREAEVMHWICDGRKNPEIAQLLEISQSTVNHHVEHIFHKLGVDNRLKAIKTVQERLGV